MKFLRVADANTDSSMNETSTIDTSLSGRNEIKVTLSDAEQRLMIADARRPTILNCSHRNGEHRRKKNIFWKIRIHHNNIVFLLVPFLLMILKETSALPPIIKIGEWQILSILFHTIS